MLYNKSTFESAFFMKEGEFMTTDDFDYFLPEELIAQTPLKQRDSSRLLVLDKETGEVEHKHFRDILDSDEFNSRLKREVIFGIDHLIETLKMFLELTNKSLPDLESYKINTLYGSIERHPENIVKMFLSMMDDVKKKELK